MTSLSLSSLSLSIGSCALSCLLQESQGLRSTPHYPSQGYIAGWAQGPLSPMNPQSNLRLLSAHLAFPSTPHPCSLAMPTKHGAALTKVTSNPMSTTSADTPRFSHLASQWLSELFPTLLETLIFLGFHDTALLLSKFSLLGCIIFFFTFKIIIYQWS